MGGKQVGFSGYELTSAKKHTKREKIMPEMQADVREGHRHRLAADR